MNVSCTILTREACLYSNTISSLLVPTTFGPVHLTQGAMSYTTFLKVGEICLSVGSEVKKWGVKSGLLSFVLDSCSIIIYE